MKKVAVIMGSDSDFPVVKDAVTELKKYGVPVECMVMSAHRTPELTSQFADSAKDNGFGVIICAAGMAACLACFCVGTQVCRMFARKSELSSDFIQAHYLVVREFLRSAKLFGLKQKLCIKFQRFHFVICI